jgi:hypothetical protein
VNKRVPTDAELNRAMAEACGIRVMANHLAFRLLPTAEDENCGYIEFDSVIIQRYEHGLGRIERKDYLMDRSLLPEIWALFPPLARPAYLLELQPHFPEEGRVSTIREWRIMSTEPRHHVIAALKVLGRWSEDWLDIR